MITLWGSPEDPNHKTTRRAYLVSSVPTLTLRVPAARSGRHVHHVYQRSAYPDRPTDYYFVREEERP